MLCHGSQSTTGCRPGRASSERAVTTNAGSLLETAKRVVRDRVTPYAPAIEPELLDPAIDIASQLGLHIHLQQARWNIDEQTQTGLFCSQQYVELLHFF